ncbi:putative Zn(II)2Cys6 transcription factor [Pseudovirgaria hyperparasitica]|uniref:Putative Zn(II)2Cys6 transcription factor n=1 Tax=Pseudovirgaria hyperparasitica TaxID=470096 RepID=A0A6A6VX52_9PEZI|nr:putative Zn(II)2Cys6 transcription factor [Pseudovirgaria hyperparasitica]KAF2753837.1 putative Zn(II)2Cys6 transcription factor [Pseudovirgaria hyperparasitica]
MSAQFGDAVHKKVRKGTRSCTECRRRKVRCTWSSDDAQICRRCEERGTTCVAQIYSSAPVRERKYSSRDRISQLENKISNLTRAVRNIESKLGHEHTETPESPRIETRGSQDIADSEDDTDSSENFPSARPEHLENLFKSDWMTSKAIHGRVYEPKGKSHTHLIDAARNALQPLVPTKENLTSIASFSSKWIALQQALFPTGRIVKSQEEMLEKYDTMRSPDVDIYDLCQWLLAVALTAQQIPDDQGSPTTQARRYQSAAAFSRAVCDATLNTIFNQDSLLGTIEGLSVSMSYLRLQLTRGSFLRTYLQSRRVIALAELLGLPRIARNVRLGKIKISSEADPNFSKTEIWESLCGMDRAGGMIYNVPVTTKRYRTPSVKDHPVSINGEIQCKIYMATLSDLSLRLQDLDDIAYEEGEESELYAEVLKIDSELRALASYTPHGWWDLPPDGENPECHLQFWHLFITMRAHLPFLLRRDPSDKYAYSRIAGMDACRSVSQRYLHIRRAIPSGFFICKPMDMEGFISTTVLLLATHNIRLTKRPNETIDVAELKALILNIIELMNDKSSDAIGSDIARRGALVLRSLYDCLLEDSEGKSTPEELTVKVPILGQIHVQRNPKPVKPVPQAPVMSTPVNQPATWQGTAAFPEMSTANEAFMGGVSTTNTGWSADPFSWSITHGQEAFFQDALMTGNFEQFTGALVTDQTTSMDWLGTTWSNAG